MARVIWRMLPIDLWRLRRSRIEAIGDLGSARAVGLVLRRRARLRGGGRRGRGLARRRRRRVDLRLDGRGGLRERRLGLVGELLRRADLLADLGVAVLHVREEGLLE